MTTDWISTFAFDPAFVEDVQDDGEVRVRAADGRPQILRVPLEQVPRLRRLIGRFEESFEEGRDRESPEARALRTGGSPPKE